MRLKIIFNFSLNLLKANFMRLKKPFKLTFAVTNKCNSRCKTCNIWKIKKHNELSTKEIKKFFVKNNYFNWIDITGGEVFLRKDITEIVKSIIDNNEYLYLLHIPTNALLPQLVEKKVSEILKLKPNKFILTISIDGPEKIHDNIRGIKGNFEKATNLYKKLTKKKRSNFEVYVGMTISKDNYNQVEKTFQAIKKIVPNFSRDKLHINVVHTSEHYYQNKLNTKSISSKIIYSIDSFYKKRKLKLSGVEIVERIYIRLLKKYLRFGKTPISCQAFSGSAFINSQGNVYPCVIWNKKMKNIKDCNYDLAELWNEDEVKKVYQQARQQKCPNCCTACEINHSILASIFSLFFKIY